MESNIAGLYDLDKVLGKGHYGIVRLARHVFSGQEVAVKVIDKTKLDQRETEHLLKEVQCMKLVRHPNVVRLYHVITTKSKLYLVLELGNGGDLLDYLNKMPHGIGEQRTRDYFCQIIRAIAYCHHLHIVHRDLKPENIIFNEDYTILKLTDFGFSNEFSPGEKLMTYCGSWKYSAPEILLQEEYDPPAVDVWSLGVMLFQMVAGRLPFSEVNESETLTKIMDGCYEMPEDISDQLQDLLSRMIVVEPRLRITVDEIVNHPWCAAGKKGGPINGLVHEVGISPEEHDKVAKIISDNKIATQEMLERSLDANSYDYISATYLLLAEQLKQKRTKEIPALVGHALVSDRRRGSMPEVHVELMDEIKNKRWKVREAPESSRVHERAGLHESMQRTRPKPFRINNRTSGSGSSCSEDDPQKSPTLGGDKFQRDQDTFIKGKLKASPKRVSRRTIGSLNIHAINSSSGSSESEDDEVPVMENVPRSKTLTRLFRRMTPPSTRELVNIEEGSEEGDDVSHLAASKSQPGTLRKKKAHSPLHAVSSLESAHSSSSYAEEAVDMVSPLSTPLAAQRKRDGASNHSSFSSSVELSSDDSDMDLARRKKLVSLSKRDRSSSLQDKKESSRNMLALVQEKLKHLEHMKDSETVSRVAPVTPSGVLPNIAEYTSQQTSRDVTTIPRDVTTIPRDVTTIPRDVTTIPRDVTMITTSRHASHIRHHVTWNIEDIERANANYESNGDVSSGHCDKSSSHCDNCDKSSGHCDKSSSHCDNCDKSSSHCDNCDKSSSHCDNCTCKELEELRRTLSSYSAEEPIELFGGVKSTVCSVM